VLGGGLDSLAQNTTESHGEGTRKNLVRKGHKSQKRLFGNGGPEGRAKHQNVGAKGETTKDGSISIRRRKRNTTKHLERKKNPKPPEERGKVGFIGAHTKSWP